MTSLVLKSEIQALKTLYEQLRCKNTGYLILRVDRRAACGGIGFGESYEPLQIAVVNRCSCGGGTDRFYLEDSGEKLLIPDELEALQEEIKARQQARERAEQAEALLARYRERFGELPE